MNENYSYYKVYLYVWHKKFEPVRFITKIAIVYICNICLLYADKFEKKKGGGGTPVLNLAVMVLLLYLQSINFLLG